jgi:hypothetical protein
MRLWKKDKEWSEGFFLQVREIIRDLAGELISIQKAEDEDDIHKATDFTVKVETGDIACRIRRSRYLKDFGDITIRYSRPSGTPTEYEKIRKGFAKWFFYGWADENDKITAWIFVDLDKLRASGLLENRTPVFNKDGTSFVAIPITDLEKNGCIKAEFRDGIKIVVIQSAQAQEVG